MDLRPEGRGQKHHGSLAKCYDHYSHPADGVFDYGILLACAICPRFFAEVAQWQKKPSQIESVYINYIIVCVVRTPGQG